MSLRSDISVSSFPGCSCHVFASPIALARGFSAVWNRSVVDKSVVNKHPCLVLFLAGMDLYLAFITKHG